ncbi:hypothetical protein ACFGVR_08280 [Mucilaginibacter sp. AW1-3]
MFADTIENTCSYMYKIVTVTAFVFWVVCAFGQTDTGLVTRPKSGFQIGIAYTNNDVYLGRTDTVTTPYFSPKLTYTLKAGIYFSGSLEFITNRKKGKLDGSSLEAGYDHSFNDNLEGGTSFTKLFYNSNSTQVSSSISSMLNVYVDYDIADIITSELNVGYNFGKNGGAGGDFVINPNISHQFEADGLFNDDDLLLITLQAGLNAGSQNFYGGYLERKDRLTKKGATAANKVYDNYYDALSKFILLDYEFTVPVEYRSGKFSAQLTPTYTFAKDNLPRGTTAEQVLTKVIEASQPFKASVFYLEVGLYFKF